MYTCESRWTHAHAQLRPGCLQCSCKSTLWRLKREGLAHSSVQRLVSNAAGFLGSCFFFSFFPMAVLGFISWRPCALRGSADRSSLQKCTVGSLCSGTVWHLVSQDLWLFKCNAHQPADGWETLFWLLVSHPLRDWCYFLIWKKKKKSGAKAEWNLAEGSMVSTLCGLEILHSLQSNRDREQFNWGFLRVMYKGPYRLLCNEGRSNDTWPYGTKPLRKYKSLVMACVLSLCLAPLTVSF